MFTHHTEAVDDTTPSDRQVDSGLILSVREGKQQDGDTSQTIEEEEEEEGKGMRESMAPIRMRISS
jgi:hypothetical protein